MTEKNRKKIKDLKGLGFKTGKAIGNLVKPFNEFTEFKKEEIQQSVPRRFETIVEKYPGKVAVKTGTESITYQNLNKKANRVAHAALEAYDDRYKLSRDEKTRYARQMLLHQWGVEAQEKLKSTTVFAAGAGGSGSPLIMQLALLGFGTIIICDFDDVDLSNLNRQVLHDESRININKALSAKKTVEKINPHTRVAACIQKITADNVDDLVGDAVVIFDNVDDIEAKFVLSQCAVRKKIPHIISSMIDMDAYAAIFYPPNSPCFHCLYDPNVLNELEEIKQYSENYGKAYKTFPNPVASPSLFLATGFAVNEAVKIILGFDKIATNKFFFFDQRGTEYIVNTEGYRKITYPFSRFFRQLCKEQGFDWDEGKPGDFVKELTTAPDPHCPICGKINKEELPPSAAFKGCTKPGEERSEPGHRTAALLFGQGIDMVAGMMGVLKSGMIYVPLDPTYPEERLVYILEDSEARLIVTNQDNVRLAVKLRDKVNKNIAVIDINEIPGTISAENPEVTIEHSDLAYILYTSGSTGTPKGVMQNHRNVLHFARVYTNALHIHKDDKLTLFSSYSFDAAKMDIYGALLNGAALYPYDIKAEDNLQKIPQWLRQEGITIYHSIPTVYRYFIDMLTPGEPGCFPLLRLIVLGGEAVFKKDIDIYKKYFADHCLFVNGLGPTESTVTVQYFIDKHTEIAREAVPVGFAVDETQVYLLNEQNKEPGVFGVGEIIFKSDYLALGYWNLPEQTQRVFMTDPALQGAFSLAVQGVPDSLNDRCPKTNDRVYRTGDLGRRLPDGSIEYAGRKDFQVKVSGYRIELGEIESRLDHVMGIKKSAVVCRKDFNHENFLTAYYTETNETEIDENRLVDILKTALPDYMIPSLFLSLPEFPLTSTGKIDRKILSEQDIAYLFQRDKGEAPANETESRLVELWKELLKEESVGVNENFFVLGGNSIKAILLVSRIQKELGIEISLTEIFRIPTIKELAKYVESAKKRMYKDILPVEKRDYYPLSSAQERLFFLNWFEEKSTRFNIPVALSIHGPLDIERYTSIIETLIQRHDALRTSFHSLGDQSIQRVHSSVVSDQGLVISGQGSVTSGGGPIRPLGSDLSFEDKIKDFIRPFDLSRAPLFRVGVFSLSEYEHYLLFDIHHIIFDGTSMDVLIQDFMGLLNGEALKPLEVRYKDFTLWQKNHFERGIIKKAGDYWLNLYSDAMEGEVPRLNLPTDFPRPDVMSYEGDSYRFSLDKDTSETLKKMALENHGSLFMLLLAIYNVFLSKLSGQEDIISAVVVSGRNHRDTENVIGVFINMLALRNYPREEKRFPGFLEEVGKSFMEAFENRDYPFEELIEKVPGARDVSRHPLADVGFTLQNAGMGMDMPYEDAESELRLVSLKSERKSARNDLNLEGFEIRDCVEFEFQYRTKLFKEETIVRFARYFKTLISEILENPAQKIGDIELLTGEEKERLLKRFNNTEKKYPEDKTVFQCFEERAEQHPEAIAVRSSIELQNIYDRLKPEDVEVELTYEELNERANQLARLLRERGVQRNSIVGLMVQHPLEKVIGIWGILKSGGAYLPLDPLYPLTVINSILADSRVTLLVSETGLEETLSEISIPPSTSILFIDEPGENDSLENPEFINAMSDLAYIIYTSGTTGRAKGTSIEHKGIANYARWRIDYFDFTAGEVTLQPLTYSFDSFCANFYAALLSGSELVIVPDNRRLDYDYIVGLVRAYSVTNVCFAPGIYNALLEAADGDDLNSLKWVVLAGEAAGPELIRKSMKKLPHTRLANEYGPTEATVAATAHPQIEETTTAIIGTPISNAQVYILNDSFKPVLPGMVGEIFIGGTGVARGYLNSPELTAEKFDQDFRNYQDYQDKKGNKLLEGIDKNPLTSLPLYPSTSLYRSGDLGRWTSDGNIEFLGRKDFQVKIRGHRIELEQVESILVKHEQIKEVLVDVKGKADNRYICAYIVPCDPHAFYTAGIKDYLNERLPYYMVPSHFVQIEKFPLTHNGKINRKALPDPEFTAGDEYTAPRNQVENKLVQIWAEVLNLEQDVIGIDSNFFDLGGHSLRATMLISKVQKEMEFKIPLTDFFDSPTIRGLSGLMEISAAVTPARDFIIEPAVKKEYYSLSSVQKRLYLLQQMNPQNTAYNNIQPVLMEGAPDKEKLTAAFRQLIKRHEGLRTSYEMIKGKPVQKVHEEVPFEFDGINLESDCRETREPDIEAVVKDYGKPFDLTRAPLFRVGLGQIREEKFLLILETHHIISDIISHGIFIRDFTTLYTGGEIPPLKLQYKDFSEWQNSDHVKEAMKRQESYWLREFDREIPLLNLPVDYPRPGKRNLQGNSVDFFLAKEESDILKKLAREEDVTPFMLLLSIFNVFLSKICSQEEIVVGIPFAGRAHPDLNNIMGMFANTLVLLNGPFAEKTFRDFLMEVKQRALKAYENQEFPFEQLVNQVVTGREPGRNPMFDVMFNFRGADTIEETSAAVIPGLKLTLQDYETTKSKFDMTLYVQDNGEMFHFMIVYSTQLFKKETIENFAGYFKKIMEDVTENTNQKIANIEIMAKEKIEKISARFSENLEDE